MDNIVYRGVAELLDDPHTYNTYPIGNELNLGLFFAMFYNERDEGGSFTIFIFRTCGTMSPACLISIFFVNQGSFDYDSNGAGGASRGLGGSEDDERGDENIVLTEGIVFQVLRLPDAGCWCVPHFFYVQSRYSRMHAVVRHDRKAVGKTEYGVLFIVVSPCAFLSEVCM